MKNVFVKGFALAAVVAMSFTNIACESKPADVAEESVEAIDSAATETAEAIDSTATEAAEAIDSAATETAEAIDSTAAAH